MILFSIVLGFSALLLSATFSGSETAFYRIPKLRLHLDVMANDPVAKRISRLIKNPSMFVATVLVGNNVANNIISFATVLFVCHLMPHSRGIFVEIGSTLILAPFLFVYGEMFPKYLSLRAPNRMLRLYSPILVFCYWFFIPVTALLQIINIALTRFLGTPRQLLQWTLGRQELVRVLDEGQETGILFEAQRRLANGIFNVSNQLIKNWVIPQSHFPIITTNMKPAEVLEIARQNHCVEMPVYDHEQFHEQFLESQPANSKPADSKPVEKEFGDIPVGYVRTIDLEIAVRNQLDEQSRLLLRLLHTELPIRSTVEISSRHTLLTGMILIQTLHGSFGCIVNEHRQCIGFVRSDQLRDVLLGKIPPTNPPAVS
ncbi:MAG: CNNM domain-containing protein [Planctomycetaceae bacterium]|jgi:CBS domain containing-hemolysin-like protein|nr:CNNM domain-containing protein [Planctomycetaceae bacterium]